MSQRPMKNEFISEQNDRALQNLKHGVSENVSDELVAAKDFAMRIGDENNRLRSRLNAALDALAKEQRANRDG